MRGDDDLVVALEGLVVEYGNGPAAHRAVDEVDLLLPRGSVTALVGESGSGKSTLALAVAGFLRPQRDVALDHRRFDFLGRPVRPVANRSQVPACLPGVAMMFQDAMTSLDPVWTIGSQLTAVLAARSGVPRRRVRAAAVDWLRRVGLDDTERVLAARPYELSGGMRQRVMLALTLCGNPQLVVADEPTSALDASLARAAMRLLVDLAEEQGSTLLIVSHDIDLCEEFADRLVVLHNGRAVETLDAGDLRTRAEHPYTRALVECVPSLESMDLHRLPTLATVAPRFAHEGNEVARG
jgi:peptide/nickel transport system ATP-binding protein